MPSQKEFTPIGHVALGIHSPDDDEKVGLPRSGVVWVHRLYVSFAVQQRGLGAATMRRLEQVAALEPFSATVVALDTVVREVFQNETLNKLAFDDRGLPRPRVSFAVMIGRWKPKLKRTHRHRMRSGTSG